MRRALGVEVTNIGKMEYLPIRAVFGRLALDLTVNASESRPSLEENQLSTRDARPSSADLPSILFERERMIVFVTQKRAA
jgi:hypothetical protein